MRELQEVTASRCSVGCDKPMAQNRGRAAAAMAKAAGQGGRSRHRCGALRAHSNTAARTPPASQNLPRARPRTNRARIRTHAARDGGGEQICRAWSQILLARPKRHINARRPRPRRSAPPRPSPGRARPRRQPRRGLRPRATAPRRRRTTPSRKKHTHEARPPTSVLGREARASRTTDAGRRAPNVSRDRL